MKRNLCLIGLIIGTAGLGGAIELGSGLAASVIILVLSIAGIAKEIGHVEKKHDTDNDASYPCFLKK